MPTENLDSLVARDSEQQRQRLQRRFQRSFGKAFTEELEIDTLFGRIGGDYSWYVVFHYHEMKYAVEDAGLVWWAYEFGDGGYVSRVMSIAKWPRPRKLLLRFLSEVVNKKRGNDGQSR